jgi:hypothetical protein
MIWRSISRYFPDLRQAYSRELRKAQAYKAVFQGSPTREDQEIVLADLACASGWLRITPDAASDARLRMQEGKRALYAHIWSFLSLNGEDVMALENAARREAAFQEKPQP